jgi:Transposase
MSWTGERVRLFVGDDWAEDHHDVELMDAAGRVLARKRLPEGAAGMARLHGLTGEQLGEDADAEVVTGIETGRGPWVAALAAAGYVVYAVNPLQASLNASPGARARYDELRARGIEHNDALRRPANRLVGILHRCLETRTLYDEATAWSHRQNLLNLSRSGLTPKLLDVFLGEAGDAQNTGRPGQEYTAAPAGCTELAGPAVGPPYKSR